MSKHQHDQDANRRYRRAQRLALSFSCFPCSAFAYREYPSIRYSDFRGLLKKCPQTSQCATWKPSCSQNTRVIVVMTCCPKHAVGMVVSETLIDNKFRGFSNGVSMTCTASADTYVKSWHHKSIRILFVYRLFNLFSPASARPVVNVARLMIRITRSAQQRIHQRHYVGPH